MRSPAPISFPDSEAVRLFLTNSKLQGLTPSNTDSISNYAIEMLTKTNVNHFETALHRHKTWLGSEEMQGLISNHAV